MKVISRNCWHGIERGKRRSKITNDSLICTTHSQNFENSNKPYDSELAAQQQLYLFVCVTQPKQPAWPKTLIKMEQTISLAGVYVQV